MYEIVTVPCATPVIVPVLPTVATDVFEDDQLPTVVEIASVVVAPTQTEFEPLIEEGASITVSVKVAAGQPFPSV